MCFVHTKKTKEQKKREFTLITCSVVHMVFIFAGVAFSNLVFYFSLSHIIDLFVLFFCCSRFYFNCLLKISSFIWFKYSTDWFPSNSFIFITLHYWMKFLSTKIIIIFFSPAYNHFRWKELELFLISILLTKLQNYRKRETQLAFHS